MTFIYIILIISLFKISTIWATCQLERTAENQNRVYEDKKNAIKSISIANHCLEQAVQRKRMDLVEIVLNPPDKKGVVLGSKRNIKPNQSGIDAATQYLRFASNDSYSWYTQSNIEFAQNTLTLLKPSQDAIDSLLYYYLIEKQDRESRSFVLELLKVDDIKISQKLVDDIVDFAKKVKQRENVERNQDLDITETIDTLNTYFDSITPFLSQESTKDILINFTNFNCSRNTFKRFIIPFYQLILTSEKKPTLEMISEILIHIRDFPDVAYDQIDTYNNLSEQLILLIFNHYKDEISPELNNTLISICEKFKLYNIIVNMDLTQEDINRIFSNIKDLSDLTRALSHRFKIEPDQETLVHLFLNFIDAGIDENKKSTVNILKSSYGRKLCLGSSGDSLFYVVLGNSINKIDSRYHFCNTMGSF